MQSMLCNLCYAIVAMQSLLCKLCYASFAMQALLCFATQYLLCNLCSAIIAMQSLLCNLCYAIIAMQSLLCNLCDAIFAMQSLRCIFCGPSMVVCLNAILPCMLDLVRIHTRRDKVPRMLDLVHILRVCGCGATWGYLRQREILENRPTYYKRSKNP